MADCVDDLIPNDVRDKVATAPDTRTARSTRSDAEGKTKQDHDPEECLSGDGEMREACKDEDDQGREEYSSEDSSVYLPMTDNGTGCSSSSSDSDGDDMCTITSSTDDVSTRFDDVSNMADDVSSLSINGSDETDHLLERAATPRVRNANDDCRHESEDISKAAPARDGVIAHASCRRKACRRKYDVNAPRDALSALPNFSSGDGRSSETSLRRVDPETEVVRPANNRLSRTKCSVRLLKRQYGRLRKENAVQGHDYIGFFYIRSAAPKIRADVRTSLTVSKLKSVFEGRHVFGVKADNDKTWIPIKSRANKDILSGDD